MDRKRLRILRDALKRAAAKGIGNVKFDLNTWASSPEKYNKTRPSKALLAAIQGKNYCGTTACACGLATTIPSFKRDGLRLIERKSGWDDEGWDSPDLGYKGKRDFDAAAAFFNVSYEDAAELFAPDAYPKRRRRNPLAVVAKIEALLGGKLRYSAEVMRWKADREMFDGY